MIYRMRLGALAVCVYLLTVAACGSGEAPISKGIHAPCWRD